MIGHYGMQEADRLIEAEPHSKLPDVDPRGVMGFTAYLSLYYHSDLWGWEVRFIRIQLTQHTDQDKITRRFDFRNYLDETGKYWPQYRPRQR